MARPKPPMRVLNRDEKEFKRLRNNYRAKVNRIRKKTGFPLEKIDTWLDIEIPTLKDFRNGAFSNRDEYNAFKNKLSRVNSRTYEPLQVKQNSKGMLYPKIVSQIGKATTDETKETINKRIEKYSKLPVMIDGKEQGTVDQRQLMLSDKESYGLYKPEDFDIDNYSNPKSVENNINKNKERQSDDYYDERMHQMKLNFMSMFQDTDEEENDEIVERLKNIPPDEFYELYLMLPEMSFEDWDSDTGGFVSGDKSPAEVFGYYLDIYEQGGLDISLKGIG